MPEICRFYGIVIRMYPREHGIPHFHAQYGENIASVMIHNPRRMRGRLPLRAQRLVVEWTLLYQEELLEAWNQVRSGMMPNRIAPLE